MTMPEGFGEEGDDSLTADAAEGEEVAAMPLAPGAGADTGGAEGGAALGAVATAAGGRDAPSRPRAGAGRGAPHCGI